MEKTANPLSLSRSFYGWLGKIQNRDPNLLENMPPVYPTHPLDMKYITEATYSRLLNTKHEERALYWKEIFSNFTYESRLDEGVRDFFKRLFKSWTNAVVIDPKSQSESLVVRQIEKVFEEMLKHYKEMRDRGRYKAGIVSSISRLIEMPFSNFYEDQIRNLGWHLEPDDPEVAKSIAKRATLNSIKWSIPFIPLVGPIHMLSWTWSIFEYMFGLIIWVAIELKNSRWVKMTLDRLRSKLGIEE